ncbi:MAG: hypothetical protein DI537_38310 [Stutzerimonas stutzeri]|nr:MAG: hypothetical protein DI537_38310 [Stutzerimonas stutzeri]
MKLSDWKVDNSAGRPILTYKGCSVIEAEDAEFVLSAIKAALSGAEPAAWLAEGQGWGRVFISKEAAEKLASQGGELKPLFTTPKQPLPSVAVTDEQIIDLLAIHSNHKEKAVARDGSGVIEYEVISHARAIKFARAIVEAACPTRMQDEAQISDRAIAVVWKAAMTAAANIIIKRQNDLNDDDGPMQVLEEQGECISAIKTWMEADEVYLNELRQMLVASPAKQDKCRHDLGPVKIHLQKLIAENPEKARLASSREDLRMWFIAELISEASGRIPLLEIEGLVSRQLAAGKGGDA